MKINKVILLGFAITLLPLSISAGQYSAAMKKACPEGWEDTSQTIPVIYNSTLIPWGNGTDIMSIDIDQSQAHAHIAASNPVETIDVLPVTDWNLVDDGLTLASECLVYRNLEVDVADYIAPEPTEPNYELGWLPAVLY